MRGRRREWTAVLKLLRTVAGASQNVMLVEGEPGIGKSLLLLEAASVASARGVAVAAGRADQLGRLMPLGPLLSALEESPAPLTVARHAFPFPEGTGLLLWLAKQVQTSLERRTGSGPLLVTLDYLQWADPATLMALRTLPSRLASRPVAWLLARRTASGHDDADRLFDLLEEGGGRPDPPATVDDDAVAEMSADALGARRGGTCRAGRPGRRRPTPSRRSPQGAARGGPRPRRRRRRPADRGRAATARPHRRTATPGRARHQDPAPAGGHRGARALVLADVRGRTARRDPGRAASRARGGAGGGRARRHLRRAGVPARAAVAVGRREGARAGTAGVAPPDRAQPAHPPAPVRRHTDDATAGALVALSLLAWDEGRLSRGLDLAREAVELPAGGCHPRPRTVLARMLTDLWLLDEAEAMTASAEAEAARRGQPRGPPRSPSSAPAWPSPRAGRAARSSRPRPAWPPRVPWTPRPSPPRPSRCSARRHCERAIFPAPPDTWRGTRPGRRGARRRARGSTRS